MKSKIFFLMIIAFTSCYPAKTLTKDKQANKEDKVSTVKEIGETVNNWAGKLIFFGVAEMFAISAKEIVREIKNQ